MKQYIATALAVLLTWMIFTALTFVALVIILMAYSLIFWNSSAFNFDTFMYVVKLSTFVGIVCTILYIKIYVREFKSIIDQSLKDII